MWYSGCQRCAHDRTYRDVDPKNVAGHGVGPVGHGRRNGSRQRCAPTAPRRARARSPRRSPKAVPAPAPRDRATWARRSVWSATPNSCKGYEGSPHHRVADPRSPVAKQGCESCHGPGSKHVDDPGTFPVKNLNKLPPQEVSATCTTCHNRGEHALWDGSQHEARKLSCTTCHSVHAYKSETKQLKAKTQAAVCATCHRDKVAKLDRSGHMPVREGKMQCSTCHNTHGATNVRLLRRAIRSPNCARRATPRSAARSSGSTRRAAMAA